MTLLINAKVDKHNHLCNFMVSLCRDSGCARLSENDLGQGGLLAI
jgi:hypothetical protein